MENLTQHTFSYMVISGLDQKTINEQLFTLKFEDQGKEIGEIQVKTADKTVKILAKSDIKQDGDYFQILDKSLKNMDLAQVEAFRIKFEPQAYPAIIDCNSQYGTCNFVLENASEGALDLALQERQHATALDKIAHEQKKSYIVENIENRRKLSVLTQQSQEFKQLQKIHEDLAKQYQVMTLSKDEQQTQLAKQTESISSLRAEIKQLKSENQGLTIIDEQKTAQLADKQQKLEQALQDFDHFKQQIDEINAKYGETETGLKAKVKDFFGMIMNQLYTQWYGEEVMKLSAIKSTTQDYAKSLQKLHEDKKAFLAQKFEMAKEFDTFLKNFEVKKQGWGDWLVSFFWAEPVETDLTKLMERAKNAISLHQNHIQANIKLSNEIKEKNQQIEAITDKLTDAENEKIKALLDNINLKGKQVQAELEAKSSKSDLSYKTEYFNQMIAYKEELLKDESLKLKDALNKISSLEGEIKVLTGNEKLQLDAYFKAQFEDFKQNLQASHALNEDLKNAFDKIKLQKDNDQALIAELNEKVRKYEAQNPKFREFIEALQEEIDGKDKAYETLKFEKAKEESARKKLMAEHEAKVREYENLKAESQSIVDKLTSEKEGEQEAHQKLKAEHEDKIKNYEQLQSESQGIVDKLKTEHEAKVKAYEALQKEKEDKDQAHEKLKVEHEAKVKDYEQLQEDKAKQQSEYDEYKKQSDEKYSSINNEKLSVEEKLKQTEEVLSACRNEKDTFFSDKQALQAQVDSLNAQVNNLNQQVNQLTIEKANMQSSIALLQAEVEDLKKKYLANQAEIPNYLNIASKTFNLINGLANGSGYPKYKDDKADYMNRNVIPVLRTIINDLNSGKLTDNMRNTIDSFYRDYIQNDPILRTHL